VEFIKQVLPKFLRPDIPNLFPIGEFGSMKGCRPRTIVSDLLVLAFGLGGNVGDVLTSTYDFLDVKKENTLVLEQ
jgi:hypothetical protein